MSQRIKSEAEPVMQHNCSACLSPYVRRMHTTHVGDGAQTVKAECADCGTQTEFLATRTYRFMTKVPA